MFNLRLTTIFISALLLSCSPEPVSLEVSPEPAAVSGLNGLVDETQRFNDWLDEQWEEQLRFSPQTQTSLGLKTDYNRLDDYTLAAQDAEIGWLRSRWPRWKASSIIKPYRMKESFHGICGRTP